MTRRVRIGIDTGGTFTDVVAFDESTGELVTTKTPSTPRRPGRGLPGRRRARCSTCSASTTRATISAVSHGTTVATNQLLEGKVEPDSGSSPPRATSSCWRSPGSPCPTATATATSGSSRTAIVPADLVRTVGGRLDHTGAELRPFDEDERVAAARWFPRPRHRHAIGVCFLHSYANPGARAADARDPAPGASRRRWCRISSRGAARVPRVRAVDDHAGRRGGQAAGVAVRRARSRQRLDELAAPGVPFYVMKSNGGVLSADEVVHQPITTVLSGPAAGALGRGPGRAAAPASTGCSPATAAAPPPTSASCSTASRR